MRSQAPSVLAAAAGAAGAAAIAVVWFVRFRRGGGALAGRDLPGEWARSMTNLVHWATGVAWSSRYGLVAELTGQRGWKRGLGFGALVGLSDYVVVPLAGVAQADLEVRRQDDVSGISPLTWPTAMDSAPAFPASTVEVRRFRHGHHPADH